MAHLPYGVELFIYEIPLCLAVQENVHKNKFNVIGRCATHLPSQISFVVIMDRHGKDMCPWIAIMEFAK
jgi:hypothetical protein